MAGLGVAPGGRPAASVVLVDPALEQQRHPPLDLMNCSEHEAVTMVAELQRGLDVLAEHRHSLSCGSEVTDMAEAALRYELAQLLGRLPAGTSSGSSASRP